MLSCMPENSNEIKQNIRNIAIIAHVDHGKTTLVDGLLKQAKTFRENESYMTQELILDSNDQERERGITILAKNTAVIYKDTKINIIDTPGHADFGGEVERTLNMADGAILLVDAQEGPMPQTKFVLRKALELGLKIIVVVNKIDKKDAIVDATIGKVYDLFLDLVQDEAQLEFPVLYAIGRDEKAWTEMPSNTEEDADLTPVFDSIINTIPAPKVDIGAPFQMQVTTLDYDSYKGKYAVGRVKRGKIKTGEEVLLLKPDGKQIKAKIDNIFITQGLKKFEVQEGVAGDIISLTGIKDADIGDTISDINNPEALPVMSIEDPTLSVSIGANTSEFKGKEGDKLTSRQILDRIHKEIQTNIAMKFETDSNGQYVLSGRGELHIAVFLETLRREGFELEVGMPTVITKKVDGEEMEPLEELVIDVDNEYVGGIQAELGQRRATLVNHEDAGSNVRLTFEITTRAALGLRGVIQTLSKGTAIVNSSFLRYQKVSGGYQKLRKGVLISSETGKVAPYGLRIAQDKGPTYVEPAEEVYRGMIIGLNGRDEDMEINVCKGKQLSNMRSQGEDAIVLSPAVRMSLEQCLSFLEKDELLEITPQNLRLRKKITDTTLRLRAAKRDKM